jgi:tetratricopeptide (TPR) repeat protein
VVAAVVIMLAAHLATDSRGGRAALLASAAVLGLGIVAQSTLRRRDLVRRHAVALVVAVLVTAAGAFMTLGDAAGGPESSATFEEADVDTGMRLTVARYGFSVVRDHLLLGTGLGSWMHAFRPYQQPPVEDGIWDHAHNDYVELGAESGLIGLGLGALFALAVARSSRRDTAEGRGDGKRSRRYAGGRIMEEGDWRAGLRHTGLLRWGLAAGVVAILVHSFVDFSLRMPANLLALMVILGLLGLTGRERPGVRWAPAPALLLVVIALAAAPPVMNGVIVARGGTPFSPEEALDAADALFAEEDDAVGAEKLVRIAIDRSPANRETHEALSDVLRPGAESEAALRRALALEPWAAEVRDKLGIHLWERGEAVRAAAELEESMFRYPHLETHAYLDPDSGVFPPENAEQLRRELVEGETLRGRLALLPDPMADAIERGLRRALEDESGNLDRAAVAQDVITLLEARGRWAEAARRLRTQGEQRLDDSELLARAARNFLRVRDYGAAEETLLTAITRTPEEGVLYRELAVDVYAVRGDFERAETILDAGERNAIDLVPVYRGVTEVLARREVQHPVLTRDADEHTVQTLGEGSDGE